jgi:3-hydroxy-5-phosphonooxypentane-2,4-dione thiolase
MDMEDAVRLNAAGVGIQVFIGGEFETRPADRFHDC